MSQTIETENAANVADWIVKGGAKHDGLMIGDSNTAIMGTFDVEPWPGRPKRVLSIGLPGNGIANLAYEQAQHGWIAALKPKFVIIYAGINDVLFANQASWMTPAAWAASYLSLAQAAVDAGAIAICASYHMPGASAASLISKTQLAAYNEQVRTTVHDALYYPNLPLLKFIYVEISGSLADPATGYTPDSLLYDGEHISQDTKRRFIRPYLENALAAADPF